MRRLDLSSMLDRQRTGALVETFVFCEVGRTFDGLTKGSFSACWTDGYPRPDQFGNGIYKLLRLFIDWFPSADHAQEPEFVLSHPDLDLQKYIGFSGR